MGVYILIVATALLLFEGDFFTLRLLCSMKSIKTNNKKRGRERMEIHTGIN